MSDSTEQLREQRQADELENRLTYITTDGAVSNYKDTTWREMGKVRELVALIEQHALEARIDELATTIRELEVVRQSFVGHLPEVQQPVPAEYPYLRKRLAELQATKPDKEE